MNHSQLTSYDLVAYPSYTHAQTHPDRLAVIGSLLGLEPAAVDHCRVLEIGCGTGSNLVPMAWGLPQSQFFGIDLAARASGPRAANDPRPRAEKPPPHSWKPNGGGRRLG